MAFFPHLEIQVVEHCNLNCASCTHFSPLAEPSFISKDDFFEQLKKVGRIFGGHCKSLKIMGGEPMLHPQIADLISLAREALPLEQITIQTNGTLLERASSNFWICCVTNKVQIRVTRYPVPIDVEAVSSIANQYGADLVWHPDNGAIKSFNLYPLEVRGLCDPEKSYYSCHMKQRYILVKNHRLFPCPIAGNSEHFFKYFDLPVSSEEANSIPLDSLTGFQEYATFAESPIPFCRFCRAGEYARDIGWKVSEKKMEEWS